MRRRPRLASPVAALVLAAALVSASAAAGPVSAAASGEKAAVKSARRSVKAGAVRAGAAKAGAVRAGAAKAGAAKAGPVRATPATTTTVPRKLPLSDPAAWQPAQLQATVDAWLAAHPSVAAVSVGAAANGRVWTGGASRTVGPPPFQPGDRYGVLSVTKTMTSALVLRAVDAGLVTLDAPVPDLPGIDKPATPITVRQLLTHMSGLIDYATSPNYRAGAGLSPVDAVNLSTDFPLASAPGTFVSYANTNYLYLQVLLETITGKWLATLVADLAAELGLRETTVEAPDHNGWYGGGSGGVRSTVGDLAQWGALLFTPGRVLNPAMLAQFTTLDPHDVGMGTWPICPCYTDGAGVRRYTALGHHTVAGAMEWYPATGLAVAVRVSPEGGAAGGQAADLGLRLSNLFAPR